MRDGAACHWSNQGSIGCLWWLIGLLPAQLRHQKDRKYNITATFSAASAVSHSGLKTFQENGKYKHVGRKKKASVVHACNHITFMYSFILSWHLLDRNLLLLEATFSFSCTILVKIWQRIQKSPITKSVKCKQHAYSNHISCLWVRFSSWNPKTVS